MNDKPSRAEPEDQNNESNDIFDEVPSNNQNSKNEPICMMCDNNLTIKTNPFQTQSNPPPKWATMYAKAN